MTLNTEAFAKALAAGIAAYEAASRNEDGWIAWDGGECPLGDDPVTVLLRDGRVLESTCAEWLEWTHNDTFRDIVSYK